MYHKVVDMYPGVINLLCDSLACTQQARFMKNYFQRWKWRNSPDHKCTPYTSGLQEFHLLLNFVVLSHEYRKTWKRLWISVKFAKIRSHSNATSDHSDHRECNTCTGNTGMLCFYILNGLQTCTSIRDWASKMGNAVCMKRMYTQSSQENTASCINQSPMQLKRLTGAANSSPHDTKLSNSAQPIWLDSETSTILIIIIIYPMIISVKKFEAVV